MRYKFHCNLDEHQVSEVLATSLYNVVHSMGHNQGGFWLLLEVR